MKRTVVRKSAGTWALLAAAWTLLIACPSDPLAKARKLEAEGERAAATSAYLAQARRDPANLHAWDRAAALACNDGGVARCLQVLDLELELLGKVERHADLLAQALERRGRARLEQGLVESALEDLTRSQEVGPDRASVFAAQAKAYLMLGRRVEARERLSQVELRDPELAELRALRALMEAEPSVEEADPKQAAGKGLAPASPGWGGGRPKPRD